MGKTTVATIVYETCSALWSELVSIHMPHPSQDDLKEIARDFNRLWQFPNCIGAIDGKHCEIICPAHSGSTYYNYKNYFSVILQGVADANKRFIAIEVGGRGKQSDGGTFHYSVLNKLMESGRFNIPPPDMIPGTTCSLPYVFIGDEAYPLKTNLMRPFPERSLNDERRYFNERLSRARKCIECAFGILYAKWRILGKPIETNVEHACLIIQATCILHNVIRDLDGNSDTQYSAIMNSEYCESIRNTGLGRRNNSASFIARNVRDMFVNYFCQM